jgi:hypothetical protein
VDEATEHAIEMMRNAGAEIGDDHVTCVQSLWISSPMRRNSC